VKYFICADIHGNVRALDAVLARYREAAPCSFLFLGDCVGYGPHPDACLQRILALPRAGLLMGNHEYALLNEHERGDLNSIALEALEWSEKALAGSYDEEIEKRFAYEIERSDFLAVHGSPVTPKEWLYIFTILEADEAFYARDFHVCFVGHTHVPACFSFKRGAVDFSAAETLRLDPADRYIINPGSVGQPRDYDPRASCIVFDSDAGTIDLHRCEYDVEAEVEDFFAAGLPRYLGERLLQGM
jgi:predicted phosphodiesterase